MPAHPLTPSAHQQCSPWTTPEEQHSDLLRLLDRPGADGD